MDLEQINNEYVQSISNLKIEENSVHFNESRFDFWSDEVTRLKIDVKRDPNNAEKQKQLQEAIERVETIKKSLEESREKVSSFQQKIEDRYNEVKNNPELKKHLDEVMEKKYSRRLNKLNNDKKELENKRDRQVDLQQLVAQHPALMNNLKGMIAAKKQISDLQVKIAAMTAQTKEDGAVIDNNEREQDAALNDLIPKLQEKYKINKQNLMDYITRNGISISESDIEESSSMPAIDSKGEIDVNATLNKSIKSLNRQIKGINKDIRNNEIALNNVRGELATLNTQLNPQTQAPVQQTQASNPQKTVQQAQPLWEDISSRTVNSVQPVQPEPQPKWYQFIKRFKIWNEKRKQAVLQEPEKVNAEMINSNTGAVIQPNEQQTNQIQPQAVNEIKSPEVQAESNKQTQQPSVQQPTPEQNQTQNDNFRDSLKFDIVQALSQERMKEEIKKAKAQRKQQDRGER